MHSIIKFCRTGTISLPVRFQTQFIACMCGYAALNFAFRHVSFHIIVDKEVISVVMHGSVSGYKQLNESGKGRQYVHV